MVLPLSKFLPHVVEPGNDLLLHESAGGEDGLVDVRRLCTLLSAAVSDSAMVPPDGLLVGIYNRCW